MKSVRLLVGIGVMVTLSSALAYFAQVHRPFSETSHPFVFAYISVLATIAAVVLIARILGEE